MSHSALRYTRSVKLLLTGPRGVGKSTLIAHVLARTGVCYGGFRTERAPDGTVWLHDLLSGDRAPVGRYDPRARRMCPLPVGFENLGVRALQRALQEQHVELLVLDELGWLEGEADCPRFRATVRAAFLSAKPLLGVLRAGQEQFWREILSLPGVELIEVTQANRERLVSMLIMKLGWGESDEREDAAADRGLVAR